MRRLLIIAAMLLVAGSVSAQQREWLGHSRMFTNDYIGDGADRWRTGSYGVSFVRGDSWNGENPDRFGELIEFRVRSEIIAPADLSNPVLGTDRPYVGVLQAGAFSHMKAGDADMTVGLDLVITGPQTGLGAFQNWVHTGLGMAPLAVLGSQIGNAVYPTLSGEISREYDLGGSGNYKVAVRPFVEAQAGVETFLRVGGDIALGNIRRGDLMLRDPTTGQRGTAIKGDRARGHTFVIGGDVALMQSSRLLPGGSGYTLVPLRKRIRAGVYKEYEKGSVFYGLTWLGREFTNQPQNQIVGSFYVRMGF